MKAYEAKVKDERCKLSIAKTCRIPIIGENIQINGKEYEVTDIKLVNKNEEFFDYDLAVKRPKSVIILMGAPCSGKTTFCADKLPEYTRVTQKELSDRSPFQIFQEMLENDVREIVIDHLNQSVKLREKFLKLAKQKGYSTTIIWLQTPGDVCKERIENEKYSSTERKTALSYFFQCLESPTLAEADKIIFKG